MIAFSCPVCGKSLKAKDEVAGKKVKCSGCGKPVQIPTVVPAGPREKTTHPRPEAPSTRGVADDEAPYRLADDSVPDADNNTGENQPQPTGTTESFPKEAWSFLKPAQGPRELGRLGPYRILKVLGMGGMGVVFRGEDPHLERPVAIKAMLPELAGHPNAKQRFLREAKAAAMLKHPHIVTIYQVGDDCGVPFLAMEFLEGESLADRLERDGELPVSEVVRIGRELAEGLGAAHEKGLIHRDIKPANIWLEGPKAHAKILDFGLARDLSDTAHLTQSGAIIGTPAFMAPEQAAGKKCDHRSDIFSLGSVLYCMATGQRPFKGNDPLTLLTALAVQDPKPPDELNSAVPNALSDLILKLLEKDPRKRPQSAQEVVQALKKSRGKRQEQEDSKRKGVFVGAAVAIVLGIIVLWRGLSPGDNKAETKESVVAQKETNPPTPATPQTEAATKTTQSEKEVSAPSSEPASNVPTKTGEADVFAFLKPPTNRQLAGQEIYDKLLKSSVCIISDGGRGSGALVNKEERLVVTNHHVVHASEVFGMPGRGVPGGIGGPPMFGGPSGKLMGPGGSTAANATSISGSLDFSSSVDKVGNRRYKIHFFPMKKGDQYTIEMLSTTLDSYLRIEDSAGKTLAKDDDSGGSLNARIVFTAPKDDEYRIHATSYRSGQFGNYTLRLTPLKTGSAAATVYVLFPKIEGGRLVTGSSEYMKEMLANKERYKATVIYSDETKDLAIVQLAKLPPDVEALPLASESAKPGQSVHSIGNPGASDSFWVYTSGTVRTNPIRKQWMSSGFPVMNHNATIIETQSPTNPGDSGGPLVNEWGELVAVTQGSNLNANAVNIFIDVSEVKAVLQTKGYRWATLTKEPESVRTSLTGTNVVKLAGLLEHENPKVRTQAAILLGEGGKKSRDAVAALGNGLSDKDAAVRRAIATALGEIGPDALGALLQLAGSLSDEDRYVRVEALKAINKIGPQGASVAGGIGKLLGDSDAELQEQGLIALAKMGRDARHAVSGINKVIEAGDPKILKLALATLEKIGPEAHEAGPALQKVINKTDAGTRTRIIRMMAGWSKTGDTAKLLVSELTRNLKDADKTTCLEDLKTLESFGKALKTFGKEADPAAEAIESVYRRQKDFDVRMQSLKTLGAMGSAAGKAVPTLVGDLQNVQFRRDQKELHEQVRQTLVSIGPPAARALANTLAGGELPQRTMALQVIGEIGRDAKEVLKILYKHRETVPEMQKLLKATIDQVGN